MATAMGCHRGRISCRISPGNSSKCINSWKNWSGPRAKPWSTTWSATRRWTLWLARDPRFFPPKMGSSPGKSGEKARTSGNSLGYFSAKTGSNVNPGLINCLLIRGLFSPNSQAINLILTSYLPELNSRKRSPADLGDVHRR